MNAAPPDYDWVTPRLAVGGAICTRHNMRLLAKAGVTHIINLQSEFDDRPIAEGTGIQVFWCPCPDDFQEKPVTLFEETVAWALKAWEKPGSKILFHCAAGIHRSPMMLLAFLAAQGKSLTGAKGLIQRKRPWADFPQVYLESVARFLAVHRKPRKKK